MHNKHVTITKVRARKIKNEKEQKRIGRKKVKQSNREINLSQTLPS